MWVKNRFGAKIHLDVTRDEAPYRKAIDYCKGLTEDKVPNEVVIEWGTLPSEAQGKRHDLLAMRDATLASLELGKSPIGSTDPLVVGMAMKYGRAVDGLRALVAQRKKFPSLLAQAQLHPCWDALATHVSKRMHEPAQPRQVLWLLGSHGSGKSTLMNGLEVLYTGATLKLSGEHTAMDAHFLWSRAARGAGIDLVLIDLAKGATHTCKTESAWVTSKGSYSGSMPKDKVPVGGGAGDGEADLLTSVSEIN